MGKELFAVGAVVREKSVDINGMKADLELSWTKGMVGVLPVFDNIEDANRFANEKGMVISIFIDDDNDIGGTE